MRFQKIKRVKVTASTNADASALAKQGEPEGTVIAAESQTAGRGRYHRKWISEPGGLYFSMILKPALKAALAPQLTFVAALAVKEAIESYVSQPFQLKWPNDVMIQRKKVCGILTEVETKEDAVEFIVVGVGLNVNQTFFPKEISTQAISLFQVSKKKLSLDKVLDRILRRFDHWYDLYLKTGFLPIKQSWEKLSQLCGRKVEIRDQKKTITGTVKELDESGALIIESPNGDTERVYAGDVICY